MEHLNGILARGGGNLNNNFQKSQTPGGCPGWGGGGCFDLTDTLSPITKGSKLERTKKA